MTLANPIRLIAAMLLLGTASCASIISTSDYPVIITSNPSGAEITVTNIDGEPVYSGSTPANMTLDAGAGFFQGETYTIEATLAGYPTRQAVLDSSLDGWFLGNLIFGGPLGFLIIDPATGAMWALEDSLTVQMADAPPEEETPDTETTPSN